MKKLVILAAIILSFATTVFCAEAKHDFTSAAGGFSVTSAVDFQEQSQSVETQVGTIEMHIFVGQSGNVCFYISYSDYPKKMVEAGDPEKSLDGSRDGMVKNVGGTLIFEQKVSMNGNPGREILVDLKTEDGTDAIMRSLIFLAGNRLYQVMVLAPKGEIASGEIDEFLRSFKIIEQ